MGKLTLFLLAALLLHSDLFSQVESMYKKGSFFAYWGWNRSAYTKSDITFKGEGYNFTLENVVAKDRQSPFSAKIYLNPGYITYPQYNARLGYFFHDNYSISLGVDHMKYVMQNYQTVGIDGYISNSSTKYDGEYVDNEIVLSPDFLLFEHTDGLNYENVEIRRNDVIFKRKHFEILLNEGFGVGFLMPRTNTTLLNNPRYDKFHLAGYGIGAVGAVNLTFFKYFFIQSEAKYGFIHMPDIRTTMNKSDKAKQHFLFSQYNVVFGGVFRIGSKKSTNQ